MFGGFLAATALLAAVVGWAAPVRAQCSAAQLCAPLANPCEIAANCTVPAGSVFDLGGRALVIKQQRTLAVEGDGGITVRAASITLEKSAKVVAPGPGGIDTDGGDITLVAAGSIVLGDDSLLDASGPEDGGDIELQANGGALQMLGRLKASGTENDAWGGDVALWATGDLLLGGSGIMASGATNGAGGSITLRADGAVTLAAPIDSSGGEYDGGGIEVTAASIVTVAAGQLDTHCSHWDGSAGAVELNAQNGSVIVGGRITTSGAGSAETVFGNGGDVALSANGGSVIVSALVDTTADGDSGDGGDVSIDADLDATIAGPIRTWSKNNGQGKGGNVTVTVSRALLASGIVNADGGSGGGDVYLTSAGAATMSGAITAKATSDDGFAGTVEIQGCTVDVPAGALVSVVGSETDGTTRMRGSTRITVAGKLDAGVGGRNELHRRSDDTVVNFAAATIVPAPVHLLAPGLPCCENCPVPTTTTVTTSTTTSTTAVTPTTVPTTTSTTDTTSAPTTTTTSSLPPTTVTSTTQAPTTTTSTTLATTTTSTVTTSTATTSTTTTSTVTTSSATTSTVTTTTAPSTTVTSTTATSSTSTTSTTTASTSTTSTTSSTVTSSTLEPTSTTTTSSTSTSTTAPEASTTTTAPSTSTTVTTSTLPPPTEPTSCMDEDLKGFAAIECRLSLLDGALGEQPETALGGRRTARRLRALAKSAAHFVESARVVPEKRVAGVLKKASRRLLTFQRAVEKAHNRGKIPGDVSALLLSLTTSTSSELAVLRAGA